MSLKKGTIFEGTFHLPNINFPGDMLVFRGFVYQISICFLLAKSVINLQLAQDFVHRQYDRVRKSWEMNQRSYDIILTVPSKVMISANGWRYQLTSQQAWSGGHCISRNSHVGNYPTWQRQGVKRATIFYPIQTTFHKFNGLHSPKSCWNHIETISPRPETMLGVSWEAPTWTTLCPSQGREIQHHIDTIDLPVSLVHPGRSPRVVAEALPNFCVELPTPTKMAAKCRKKMYSRLYGSRNLPEIIRFSKKKGTISSKPYHHTMQKLFV